MPLYPAWRHIDTVPLGGSRFLGLVKFGSGFVSWPVFPPAEGRFPSAVAGPGEPASPLGGLRAPLPEL